MGLPAQPAALTPHPSCRHRRPLLSPRPLRPHAPPPQLCRPVPPPWRARRCCLRGSRLRLPRHLWRAGVYGARRGGAPRPRDGEWRACCLGLWLRLRARGARRDVQLEAVGGARGAEPRGGLRGARIGEEDRGKLCHLRIRGSRRRQCAQVAATQKVAA